MKQLEWSLIGNLGAEPENRFTPNGKAVCNLRVAVNHKYTDRDGKVVEQVEWFRITTWDKLAENCAKYLSKGRQVYVAGRGGPKINVYEANDGTWKASADWTAHTVLFLGTGGGGNAAGSSDDFGGYNPGKGEDEIPF